MTLQQQAAAAFADALLEDDPVALYERAPCGYLSTNPDGIVTKINATLLTWLGRTAEDVVGRPFRDLLTRGGRLYYETHYAPMLLMHGTVHELALELALADGSRLPVLLNAQLDRTPAGAPRTVRVAVFDATERRRYERELMAAKEAAEAAEARARTLARTLQQSLLPPSDPVVPGLELRAAYQPAGDGAEVGGDFYDCFATGPDEWLVVLGDVCGMGPEAAAVTALTRYTVRGLAMAPLTLPHVIEQLNAVVLAHESDRFCTVVLVRLRREGASWRATVASGGHPPALVVRPDGPPSEVWARGPMVGVFPGVHFDQEDVVLAPGETLLLYTDGVTEARGAEGCYGESRLHDACQRLGTSPVRLVDGLVAEVVAFRGGATADDVAVIAVGNPAL